MRKREGTIVEAIAKVLTGAKAPMTASGIYQAIVDAQLYTFHARDPLNVVKTQLRRHTKELKFPSAVALKRFSIDADGRYSVLAEPFRVQPSLFRMKRAEGGGKAATEMVSVPADDDDDEGATEAETQGPSHTEIQYRLLDLGFQMGFSVWAPASDRGRTWDGRRLQDVPSMLAHLPVRFDVASIKTIENIDVLWIEKGGIVAGFEVEHTSSIYSGLLRMADLVSMQPNIEIRFYLVAPDVRGPKFAREVIRPTFSSLRRPLHTLCRFLPYSALLELLDRVRDVLPHLKPQFLDDIAEGYDPNDETEPEPPPPTRRRTPARKAAKPGHGKRAD